jgi:GTP-binding protein EngB required for normal cell division
MSPLSANHQRHILNGFLAIHNRMANLEALIVQSTRPSPFSQYVGDLSPTEMKVIQDHFARIRAAMLGHLKELGIPPEVDQTSVRWVLQTSLIHLQVSVDDMHPKRLAGYGPVDAAAGAAIIKVQEDLARLLDQVVAYLRQGLGRDLSQRLTRLDTTRGDAATLAALDRIVTRWRLVEFRPTLDMIVSRLETQSFEIAVFGRVSSGKSSLLNHITGTDALPVGVTPVTAVPTQLTYGEQSAVIVSFADSSPHCIPFGELWEYASEQGNPGNHKHVTGVSVQLPSPRLREGLVFVDTPGVGSLASSGAAEALAYLPRCDLGIVLIDAASTLDHEDLSLLKALYEAGVPAMVLLSKADLLAREDRRRMVDYIRQQLDRGLGLDLPVQLVSVVGADESLLNEWFASEIAPLLDRHRALMEASIHRKIAGVCESVSVTLETLLDRRQGGRLGASAGIDVSEVRRLLDEADMAIRQVRNQLQDWSADRHALVTLICHTAAEALVVRRDRPSEVAEEPIATATRDVMSRRARAAHELVAGLQEVLGRVLGDVYRAAPLANADVASIREMKLGDLPVPDLNALRAWVAGPRPWWAPLSPQLAVRAVRATLADRFAAALRAPVGFYDRNLQVWANAAQERLVEQFEFQASPFREQARRLTADEGDAGMGEDRQELEADLRELQRAAAVEVEGVSARSDGLVPGVLRIP